LVKVHWLDMKSRSGSAFQRQVIRRGSVTSVRDLMIKIGVFITGWNQRKHHSFGPSLLINPRQGQPQT